MLTRVLVAAAVAWPLVAGTALWHRVTHPGDGPAWASVVYLAAGQVCHQQPERSFETSGVAWPVCARCTGLYLAAPFGAFLALGLAGRGRGLETQAALRGARGIVALAAVPTALTLAWEWGGLGTPPNPWRLVTALPLGMAVAFVVIQVTRPNQVH
jgi:uncharacterized membrane protein